MNIENKIYSKKDVLNLLDEIQQVLRDNKLNVLELTNNSDGELNQTVGLPKHTCDCQVQGYQYANDYFLSLLEKYRSDVMLGNGKIK